jgi:Tfp pilus assembly protein PilF
MKKISLVMLSFLIVASAMAQNVNEGIRQLYYQKYTAAKQTLQNAVKANSKDAGAIYWLGQALLGGANPDINGAKALYQKALNEGVNDPLIWVGMGHVELLNGRRNEARQNFEAAITNSLDRKKNPRADVLAAIGRANADGPSNLGDPTYAIEKLKKASELNTTDADIFVNMGINFQKLGGDRGGEAVQAYNAALQRDAKYARALYRIGMVYLSQQNKDLFEDFFAKAIAADPAYTPTYLALYDYYKNRDVNKALGYLQEYIRNAEPNPENEFFMADYLFRAGKYQQSLDEGKKLEVKYGIATLPKLNALYAYNYDRLKDSIQARNYIQKFLTTAKPIDIQSDHYVLAGSILAKFPGSEGEASSYLEKAIQADTVKANQVDYMTTAAQIFEKAGKYEQQYQWLNRLAGMKEKWGEIDYYRLNDVSFRAQAYKRVLDTLAPKYILAFPDKPQGYAFRVRAAKAIDTAASLGLAIEPINQQNEFLVKDTAKNKKAIYLNYYYMLLYYNDKVKDVPKAIEMTDKMMALYAPGTEEYAFAENAKKVLQSKPTRSQPKTAPGQKTGGGGTGSTTGKAASGAGAKK